MTRATQTRKQMMATTGPEILATLRNDPTSWQRLISFRPSPDAGADSDTNLDNRHHALLLLHAAHHPAPQTEDIPLIAYIVDQEILYHQRAYHYRSDLSLACYLLARYRQPAYIWAVWAARESDFDASKCVDPHYMWYMASGIEKAKEYVLRSEVTDVLKDAVEDGGRREWWKYIVAENADGDEKEAFEQLKILVIERAEHDLRCGITDETVEAFVDGPLRSNISWWD